VPLYVTAIMIGVEDLARSKKFYGEGLGCTIDQDHPIRVVRPGRWIVVAGSLRTRGSRSGCRRLF
jgi:catechol 2,3-dioxygenase-like lactoylglutathione lyase family enzyme